MGAVMSKRRNRNQPTEPHQCGELPSHIKPWEIKATGPSPLSPTENPKPPATLRIKEFKVTLSLRFFQYYAASQTDGIFILILLLSLWCDFVLWFPVLWWWITNNQVSPSRTEKLSICITTLSHLFKLLFVSRWSTCSPLVCLLFISGNYWMAENMWPWHGSTFEFCISHFVYRWHGILSSSAWPPHQSQLRSWVACNDANLLSLEPSQVE